MTATPSTCDDEFPYAFDYRETRRADSGDPPLGHFESTSSARHARSARYRRAGAVGRGGICRRGSKQKTFGMG